MRTYNKILAFVACAAVAAGCSEVDDTNIDTNILREIIVSIGLSNDADTRIEITPDADSDQGKWSVTWSEEDTLSCVSENNTHTLFEMEGAPSADGKDAEFKGSISGDMYRYLYPYNESLVMESGMTTIDLSSQTCDITVGNEFEHLAKKYTHMISNIASMSNGDAIRLKHLTSPTQLVINPSNFNEAFDYTISSVEISGESIVSQQQINLALESSDADFVSSATKGTIKLTPNNIITLEDGVTQRLNVAQFPCSFKKDETIEIKVYFREGVNYKFYTIKKIATKDLEFVAGRYNTIYLNLDIDDLEKVSNITNDLTLVKGAAFIDRFQPVPTAHGLITDDCWGAPGVVPRNVYNGMEDPDFSFWGGNIVIGDDGKYHLFGCYWPQDISNPGGTNTGHVMWWDSDVYHAVSDYPTGPFKIVESNIGKGHNPEVYRLKNGTYVIGVMGSKAYKSASINGPWEQIETTFNTWGNSYNDTNRTYIVEDDGSVTMMNKEGLVFKCKDGDIENFEQLPYPRAYVRKNDSHEEDPVIWKDEVEYNLIVNECRGRIAYHLTSKDLREWNYEEGFAYTPDIVKNDNGLVEDWWELERPKVQKDQYGRITHMNFAAIDTLKGNDIANDNHSSKNIVVPLLLERRMRLISPAQVSVETPEITVRLLAEEGFNINDIDFETLRLGSGTYVNHGVGYEVVSHEVVDEGVDIIFRGDDNGLTLHDYKMKLLGLMKNGDPIWAKALIDDPDLGSVDNYRPGVNF